MNHLTHKNQELFEKYFRSGGKKILILLNSVFVHHRGKVLKRTGNLNLMIAAFSVCKISVEFNEI